MLSRLSVISSMDSRTGGPCQGIRNSFESMKMLGVNLEVVCLDNNSDSTLWQDPFKIHAIGKGITPWYFNKVLYLWLISNLQRFDFVITHGIWQYHSYAVSKALRELKKNGVSNLPKHFVMPHGMLDPWFQRSKTRIFKAIRNWVYWKLIEHNVIQNADGLLFTCEEEMRLASTTFTPYYPKNEFNIGYGIQQPPEFVPTMMNAFYQHCPIVEGQKYLLYLSRLHPKKGLDLLINAYSAIIKDPSGQNELPNLVIAGPGLESAYGAKIQKMVAADANLRDIVHFTGMLTGGAKWGSMYGCEAFVLPSHQENFGIAVVEALACGKPVLIRDQVNIYREIKDAGAGLVASDDIGGTEQLLRDWISMDAAQKAEMSQNARLAYEKYFTVEVAAQQFLSAIIQP